MLSRPPRVAVQHELRPGHRHALGADLGAAELVGEIGGDFEADPQPAVARQLEAKPPEVQHLLHVAGHQDRHQRIVERHLGARRDGGRLGRHIVAGQRQDAAVAPHAGEVGVLEGIAAAVDPRRLAVPDADHAVVLGLREQVGELAAHDHGRAGVFVDGGHEDDLMRAQQLQIALELQIEPGQRRAAVARDQPGGIEAQSPVGAELIQRQTHQRLHPREQDRPFEQGVFRVERESVRFGHTASSYIDD